MKKFTIAALALVMAVSVLTGCGCMNSNAPMETTRPTTEATRPSTMPTEAHTTPSTAVPSESVGMTEGTGTTEAPDMTGTTETTTPMTKESGRVKSHVNGNF